jgi:hypothetical protein
MVQREYDSPWVVYATSDTTYASDLAFTLLGKIVPEPPTILPTCVVLLLMRIIRRRHRHDANRGGAGYNRLDDASGLTANRVLRCLP